MNKLASIGLAALLSFSGCTQETENVPKPATTQKTQAVRPTTLPTSIPTIIPKREITIPAKPQIREKSLDEMMISEEQTAYRNADVLSRAIPREFQKETFGDYIVYHEKGITIGNQLKSDGSPQLNGKGRAVVIRSNTDLLAGYFNYSFPGKEEGLLAKGDDAKDLWRIAFISSADLIALSTGKSSFGYSKKENNWKVMEMNMAAFTTSEEFTKAMLSDSSEEEKTEDLSKRPIRTRNADLEKVKMYQTIVNRFFSVYTPKQKEIEVIKSPSAKSIDDMFKVEEERIYNQARQAVASLKNSSKHKSGGKVIYHSPSISFSGEKMRGSGDYIMRDEFGIVISSESSSTSSPTRQWRGKGKEKTSTKAETNFIFVYGNNSITLINSKINVTYSHIENDGWMKRETNLEKIKTEVNEAELREAISRGNDFKNTDLDKMPVRAIMINLREIERYTSLKQLIDKEYTGK